MNELIEELNKNIQELNKNILKLNKNLEPGDYVLRNQYPEKGLNYIQELSEVNGIMDL